MKLTKYDLGLEKLVHGYEYANYARKIYYENGRLIFLGPYVAAIRDEEGGSINTPVKIIDPNLYKLALKKLKGPKKLLDSEELIAEAGPDDNSLPSKYKEFFSYEGEIEHTAVIRGDILAKMLEVIKPYGKAGAFVTIDFYEDGTARFYVNIEGGQRVYGAFATAYKDSKKYEEGVARSQWKSLVKELHNEMSENKSEGK